MVLEKTLESPLDCKEIQPVHPKGDQSWVFIEGLMLNLKLQYFSHLMRRTDSFEKIYALFTIARHGSNLNVQQGVMNKKRCGIYPKAISPEYSSEGLRLNLKLQYFGHLMQRADSLEKTQMLGKIKSRRRGRQRMRWLDGITDSMDEFEQALEDVQGQGSLACCSPWGYKELDTTDRLNK